MHEPHAPKPRRPRIWLTREVIVRLAANPLVRADDAAVNYTRVGVNVCAPGYDEPMLS